MSIQDILWLLLAAATTILAFAITFKVSVVLIKKVLGRSISLLGEERDAKMRRRVKNDQ